MNEFTLEELNNEVWKDVPEFEGFYQVSDLGRVKSLEREIILYNGGNYISKEKILKPQISKDDNYCQVNLYKNGKGITRQIHQLVAMAFLNHVPCGNLIEVNHDDKNRLNNRLWNLEILTKADHAKHTFPNKSSQYTGVSFEKSRNKWKAQIKINGKRKNLGYFATELEAHEARQKAEEMAKNGDFSFMKIKETSSQYKGICWSKKYQKWRAYITVNDKQRHLGYFDTEIEAFEARRKAEESAKNGDFSFMKFRENSRKCKSVCFDKSTNKWMTYIKINGKRKYLGRFLTELEAHQAVQKELDELK